jgi:protein-tyrosine phosphatase
MGITHILNVSCKSYTTRDEYFKYLHLPIQDNTGEDARKHFRFTNRFIRSAINTGGRVLVQSVNGKSRAPTFILAYLIEAEKHKLKDGLAMIRRFVPEVEPNEGFMQQLAEYDLELL